MFYRSAGHSTVATGQPLKTNLRLFSYCMTSEKEIGLFLIETFRKLFNPQNNGHLDQFRVAVFLQVKLQQVKNYLNSYVLVVTIKTTMEIPTKSAPSYMLVSK
jgi:hypothetical protein